MAIFCNNNSFFSRTITALSIIDKNTFSCDKNCNAYVFGGISVNAAVEYDRKALVFLIGASDLRRIFQEWPDRMQLAVCLRADGECKMIVYREEEGARFLPRLRRALRLPPEDICFYPEIEGYPSRRLLYSEEKQLFALVQNAAEVVEEAKDYSLNFTYALDEGIDPLSFLNSEGEAKIRNEAPSGPSPRKSRRRPRQRLHLQLAEPEKPEKAKQSAAVPRFMQKDAKSGPGQGFQSIAQIKRQNPVPKSAFVHREQNGWIAIDLPGCLGGQVTVSNPGRIFVRDDRRVVALHNDLIGKEDSVLPERINLGVKFLPEGVKDILTSNAGEVSVSCENGFLFLATKRTSASPKEPERRQRLRKGQLPWRLWASAAAILAIAAVGLQSALSPQSVSEADGAIDWSQFRSGALDANVDKAAEPEIPALRRLRG